MNTIKVQEMDTLLEKFLSRFNVSTIVELGREDATGEYEGELVRREITPHRVLDQLYSILPSKFPPLYERLVLTHRWYRSELDVFDIFDGWSNPTTFDILGNPPGFGLEGLQMELFRDHGFSETCLPNGFIQFGLGPDAHYDPICFDTSRKSAKQDYAIVQLDHEAILCKYKIRIIQTIAPSFENLVHAVISAPRRPEET
jgi:hypothetical protein